MTERGEEREKGKGGVGGGRIERRKRWNTVGKKERRNRKREVNEDFIYKADYVTSRLWKVNFKFLICLYGCKKNEKKLISPSLWCSFYIRSRE